MNTEILYKENCLTADDVILFQRKMGWIEDSKELWEKSLNHSVYSIVAVKGNETIAMGRLLGDAAMYWYLNDIFVLSNYQHQGIGRQIVKRLIQYIKENGMPGSTVGVYLMSAKGKESFYKKLGFRIRPHEQEGAGMEMEITIQ